MKSFIEYLEEGKTGVWKKKRDTGNGYNVYHDDKHIGVVYTHTMLLPGGKKMNVVKATDHSGKEIAHNGPNGRSTTQSGIDALVKNHLEN